jgi:hypothetical protein
VAYQWVVWDCSGFNIFAWDCIVVHHVQVLYGIVLGHMVVHDRAACEHIVCYVLNMVVRDVVCV